MKLLQVIPYFCFGGAETMCENLTYALRELGHDVVVVSLFDERTEISYRMEAAGVRIRYLGKKPGLDMSVVPKLTKIFREERPDVVHTHLNVILYAVMAARLAGGIPCVHTVHNVAGVLRPWPRSRDFQRRESPPVHSQEGVWAGGYCFPAAHRPV